MIGELFADLTMALEDMHGVAVDGQARDLTPDAALALLERLRVALVILEAIPSTGSGRSLPEIAVHLGAAR